MKYVSIIVGSFAFGTAVGVGLIAPRQQLDQKLVDHCRQERIWHDSLPTVAREQVDAAIRESPAVALRWKPVNTISDVK